MSNLSVSHHAEGTQASLAAFVAAEDLAGLTDSLNRLRRTPMVMQTGGVAEALAWLATAPELPGVLLVDVGTHTNPLPSLLELAAQCGPSCRIVAIGGRQDVDTYRQLLRAGIFDSLLKPVRLDLLADTLARADADQPLGISGSARSGRTVALVGAAGGVGTSTVTVALGQWLAGVRQTPTALIDFDRRKGDLPLLLGLEADAGLASMLAAPEIDPRLLQRALLTAGDSEQTRRLHLLAQRPAAETPLDPERVLQIGEALSHLFSLSLWDLPSHRPSGAEEVLAHADIRVVLTELTVQGARNVHHILTAIGDESAGQRLLLVANAVRHGGRPVLSREQFEEFVGHRIDVALPHAGDTLAATLLTGALSTTRSTPFAAAIEELGAHLLGLPQRVAQPAGWFDHLRQRFSAAPRPALRARH